MDLDDCQTNAATWQVVSNLRQERGGSLADARLLTWFLYGITSPRLSREKLTGHPLFGRLDQMPFGEGVA
ncbi:MAG: hypothetical protein M3H12_19310 [Chromatiales bacterium]|nr:hypothetical protein [Gammaproteobacteria bacterium]